MTEKRSQQSPILDPPPPGCVSGFIYDTANYFGLTLIVVILFVILLLPPIQRALIKNFPNYYTRLLVMTAIVAVVVYISNRLILDWKSKYQVCAERFQVVDVRPQ